MAGSRSLGVKRRNISAYLHVRRCFPQNAVRTPAFEDEAGEKGALGQGWVAQEPTRSLRLARGHSETTCSGNKRLTWGNSG